MGTGFLSARWSGRGGRKEGREMFETKVKRALLLLDAG